MQACTRATQHRHLYHKLAIQSGYTLNELMIAIAVIGILAAIAGVNYQHGILSVYSQRPRQKWYNHQCRHYTIQNLPYAQGETISLDRTVDGSWQCRASAGIPTAYLPQACL